MTTIEDNKMKCPSCNAELAKDAQPFEGSPLVLNSDSWRTLEEAQKVLLFAYNSLCNMTTDEFSKGEDREIRRKIAECLNIDE